MKENNRRGKLTRNFIVCPWDKFMKDNYTTGYERKHEHNYRMATRERAPWRAGRLSDFFDGGERWRFSSGGRFERGKRTQGQTYKGWVAFGGWTNKKKKKKKRITHFEGVVRLLYKQIKDHSVDELKSPLGHSQIGLSCVVFERKTVGRREGKNLLWSLKKSQERAGESIKGTLFPLSFLLSFFYFLVKIALYSLLPLTPFFDLYSSQ